MQKTGRRVWKFNTSVLHDQLYVQNIKDIVKAIGNKHDHIKTNVYFGKSLNLILETKQYFFSMEKGSKIWS